MLMFDALSVFLLINFYGLCCLGCLLMLYLLCVGVCVYVRVFVSIPPTLCCKGLV